LKRISSHYLKALVLAPLMAGEQDAQTEKKAQPKVNAASKKAVALQPTGPATTVEDVMCGKPLIEMLKASVTK